MLEIFRTFVEQPIFNLLEVIYALIPGHDLGVAIIIFTTLIRLSLWPLVRKQLHHSRKIRALQPELKKIKKAAKGDKQLEIRMQRELYKEHEINPFSTFGTLIIQIPIFIGLYQAVLKLINNPETLQTFSYSWVKELPWIDHVAKSTDKFDATLFGVVDLAQKGFGSGSWYVPAIILAGLAAVSQYYQSKHLLMDQKDARKLSEILKDAAAGKETDQSEMTAAVSRGMLIFMPIMTFIFSINLPAALSLYFIASSVVGYLQQRIILSEDIDEMTLVASEKNKKSITTSKALTDLSTDKEDIKKEDEGTEGEDEKSPDNPVKSNSNKDSNVRKSKSGGVELKVVISSDKDTPSSRPAKPTKNKSKKKRRR